MKKSKKQKFETVYIVKAKYGYECYPTLKNLARHGAIGRQVYEARLFPIGKLKVSVK